MLVWSSAPTVGSGVLVSAGDGVAFTAAVRVRRGRGVSVGATIDIGRDVAGGSVATTAVAVGCLVARAVRVSVAGAAVSLAGVEAGSAGREASDVAVNASALSGICVRVGDGVRLEKDSGVWLAGIA